MFPCFDDLAASVDDLDPVSEDFAFGEKEGRIAPTVFDGTANDLFRIVPESHRRDQLQLFIDQVRRKLPADKEALPFRGAFLSWIWRSDVGAGQKAAIDPFLLDIEMIFIAACQKEEEKNRQRR